MEPRVSACLQHRAHGPTLNQVSALKESSLPHIHFLNSFSSNFFSDNSTDIQSNCSVLRNSDRSDLSSVSNLCLKRAVSERMNRARRSGLWSELVLE
jgi:hypothetical protein